MYEPLSHHWRSVRCHPPPGRALQRGSDPSGGDVSLPDPRLQLPPASGSASWARSAPRSAPSPSLPLHERRKHIHAGRMGWRAAGNEAHGRADGRGSLPMPSKACSHRKQTSLSAFGRERPSAGIGGETRRCSRRCSPRRGRSPARLVHSSGQARMRRDAAERRLSAECGRAEARQKCGREEFDTYDQWRRWGWNPRPMDSPRKTLRA